MSMAPTLGSFTSAKVPREGVVYEVAQLLDDFERP
jgi:hypothetical protein